MIDRGFAGSHKVAGLLLFAGLLIPLAPVSAEESGKQIFEDECAACHSIGGGRGIGPDLAGITVNLPEEWLIRYIKSAEAVFKAGDARAKENRASFKRPMPDLELSDSQIKAVLAHIHAEGGAAAAGKESSTAAAQPAPAAPPSAEEIRLGQQLFEGSVRFAKGGPACNACHHIDHPAVTGGGTLAGDLTQSHSRVGARALNAMLVKAPFPVMLAAYNGKPISGGEMKALAGFIEQADQARAAYEPRSYGWRIFLGGIAGLALLLALFTLVGVKRKKRSVNQEIYDRQVRSE
jgi:mono/diheme cytochrome c family protein